MKTFDDPCLMTIEDIEVLFAAAGTYMPLLIDVAKAADIALAETDALKTSKCIDSVGIFMVRKALAALKPK